MASTTDNSNTSASADQTVPSKTTSSGARTGSPSKVPGTFHRTSDPAVLVPPPVKPSNRTTSASHLIHSMLHPGASSASAAASSGPNSGYGPGSSPSSSPQPPPASTTGDTPPAATRQPSKPQQLLNKLKLGRKPPQAGPVRDAASITTSAPMIAPSLLVTMPSGDRPGSTSTHGAVMTAPASIAGQSSHNMMGPINVAGSQSYVTHNMMPGPDGEIEHPGALAEELSPHSSVPNNPLAPLLTPFRMMKPLMPAVASRAVAGIKRPWTRRASASSPLIGPDGVLVGSSTDSAPPMGYLWVWMGSFRRWQKRFIVASEAPGVLLIYKGMNQKGKVLSISIRQVDIVEDPADPRQLKIITPTGYIFLRTQLPEERRQWMDCLHESIRLYRANLGLVEKAKDKGLLSQQEAVGDPLRPRVPNAVLNSVAGIQEATEMDQEQRKRIRVRLAEKLAEISPFQREVERHMALLSGQLLSVVTGLNVRLPSLTPSNSMMRVTSFAQSGAGPSSGPRQHHLLQPSYPTGRSPTASIAEAPSFTADPKLNLTSASAPILTAPAPMPTPVAIPQLSAVQPAEKEAAAVPAGSAASAVDVPVGPMSAGNSSGGGASSITVARVSEGNENATAAALPVAGSASQGALTAQPAQASSQPPSPPAGLADVNAAGPLPEVGYGVEPTDSVAPLMGNTGSAAAGASSGVAGRGKDGRARIGQDTFGAPGGLSFKTGAGMDGAIKAHMRPPPVKAQNLQQAFAQLLEATRYALHSQATRIAELEAENLAFQGALTLLKAQQERAWRVRPGGSFSAAAHAGNSPSAKQSSQSRSHLAEGTLSTDSDDSLCVDDDDDDLDECGQEEDALSVMTADEDAFDVVEAFDDGVDYSILDTADDATGPPEGAVLPQLHTRSKRDTDVHDAAEDMETSVQVLNALEVVRQVEYVERLDGSKHITQVLATHEPPDEPPVDGAITEKEEETDEHDDVEDEEARMGRTRLPAPRPLGKGFSIWSLLKNMIGKDLTRLTMPATINEPTSTLQRLAECLEYRSLLDRAAAEPNGVDRLMLVAVWTLTCYASQALRDGKPFNPLLGETYEWKAHDGDARYVCEQVSHHPPVLAYTADSFKGGWELQGELETKSKFWGKSAEVLLWGCEALKLKQWGEEYRWNRANICVQDVILGSYWIEVYGKVRVENTSTGGVAQLHLKPCRRRMGDRGKLEGTISDASGNQIWALSGSTADKIYAQLTPYGAQSRGLSQPPPAQLVWEKAPYPPDAQEQYWFTKFAIGLNDPADRIVPWLPPTDSRFRPDQRALEVGEWNKATSEKLRLEEKQRQARRERNKLGLHYQPAWFKHVDPTTLTHLPDQPGFAWSFTGDYWQHRANKDWSKCLDLYSHAAQVVVPKIGAQPPSP